MSEHSERVAVNVQNALFDFEHGPQDPVAAISTALKLLGALVVEQAHAHDRLEDIFCAVDRWRS